MSSRVSQGSLKSVPRILQGGSKGIFKMIIGGVKGVFLVLYGYFWISKKCFRYVLKVFH